MTHVNPDVDLQAFARSAPVVARPKRRWKLWIIPILLIAAAGALFFDSLRSLVSSAPRVQVIRPVPLEGGSVEAGRALFQAAGWVEPDPAPILVTALEPGVLMDVRVQQGDPVKTGDVVGRLADEEQRLIYAQAEARQKLAEAKLATAQAAAAAARENWQHALALNEALAVSDSELNAQRAETALQKAAIQKAESQLETAQAELAVQEALLATGATSAWNRDLARAAVRQAQSEVASAQAAVQKSEADEAKLAARKERARQDLALRIEDRLRVETTRVAVTEAEAEFADAQSSTELARLRFSRTLVRAPLDGIVLERRTGPGTVVGPEGGDTPPVVSLYDPANLRIRVDVPQDKVSGVQPQQRALILSEARREKPYEGVVTRIVHSADINKVTLQVHVHVTEPDALLRPEMLCQVRFISSAEATAGTTSAQTVSIPAALVQNGSVWVLDPVTQCARRRSVQSQPRNDGTVAITSGLNVTDRVISAVDGATLETLQDGQHVQPAEH